MRKYLRIIGWFREFIQNFSVVAAPLYNALKQKGALIWNEDMNEAFAELKLRLINARNLKLPEFEKKLTLKTDANSTGLDVVLLQEDKNGKLIPVQWASKKLAPIEMRYGISEKEILAVKWGIEKFSYERKARMFHLIKDHKALEVIRNKPVFDNNRLNR